LDIITPKCDLGKGYEGKLASKLLDSLHDNKDTGSKISRNYSYNSQALFLVCTLKY